MGIQAAKIVIILSIIQVNNSIPMKALIPILETDDIRATLDFYTNILGFRKNWVLFNMSPRHNF